MEIGCNVFAGGRATLFMIRNPQIPKMSFSKLSVKYLTKTAVDLCLLKIKQICPNPNTCLEFRAGFTNFSRSWVIAQI